MYLYKKNCKLYIYKLSVHVHIILYKHKMILQIHYINLEQHIIPEPPVPIPPILHNTCEISYPLHLLPPHCKQYTQVEYSCLLSVFISQPKDGQCQAPKHVVVIYVIYIHIYIYIYIYIHQIVCVRQQIHANLVYKDTTGMTNRMKRGDCLTRGKSECLGMTVTNV